MNILKDTMLYTVCILLGMVAGAIVFSGCTTPERRVQSNNWVWHADMSY